MGKSDATLPEATKPPARRPLPRPREAKDSAANGIRRRRRTFRGARSARLPKHRSAACGDDGLQIARLSVNKFYSLVSGSRLPTAVCRPASKRRLVAESSEATVSESPIVNRAGSAGSPAKLSAATNGGARGRRERASAREPPGRRSSRGTPSPPTRSCMHARGQVLSERARIAKKELVSRTTDRAARNHHPPAAVPA